MQFTLRDIQHEADFSLLNLDKLFIGPVSLEGSDLRQVSSHPIKALSSLASKIHLKVVRSDLIA